MRRREIAVLVGMSLLCFAGERAARTQQPIKTQPIKTQPIKAQPIIQALGPTHFQPEFGKANCVVSGTVRDEAGAVIPGADVQVVEAATGAVYAVTANASGYYCAVGLPPGRYSVALQKPGFRALRIEALTVSAGHPVQADALLKHAAVTPPDAKVEGPPPPPTATPTTSGSGAEHPDPTSGKPPAQLTASSSGDALGEAEAAWFKQLRNGSIQYNVPNPMVIGQGITVTATVNGFKAPAPTGPEGSTAPAPLKVSDWMRIELTDPDNPGAFTIASDPSQNPQFVPIDSGATWSWTVTPQELGKNEKLEFQTYVLYDDQGKVKRALPSAQYVVTVHAEGVVGLAHIFENAFWLNPTNWFRYMLPGGAGFGALAAVIVWWRKRRQKAAPEAAKTGE